MEWINNPDVTMSNSRCVGYKPPGCGHKCSDYCSAYEMCGIYFCSTLGCANYSCFILIG